MLTEAHFSHKPELFDDDLVVKNRAPGDVPSRLGDDLLDLGNMTLRDIEERAIVAALDRVDGNKVEAAAVSVLPVKRYITSQATESKCIAAFVALELTSPAPLCTLGT